MNPIIKKIAEETHFNIYNSPIWNGTGERFVEAIIKECIKQGDTLINHYINTHPEQEQVMLLASIADYSNEIRKHFGIEE